MTAPRQRLRLAPVCCAVAEAADQFYNSLGWRTRLLPQLHLPPVRQGTPPARPAGHSVSRMLRRRRFEGTPCYTQRFRVTLPLVTTMLLLDLLRTSPAGT